MNKYITAGFKDEMVKTSFAKPPKLKKVLNYAKDYANENPYKTLGSGTAAALTGGVAVASQKADKEEIKEFLKDYVIDTTAGGVSGAGVALITQPLDTKTIRQQAGSKTTGAPFSGLSGRIKKTMIAGAVGYPLFTGAQALIKRENEKTASFALGIRGMRFLKGLAGTAWKGKSAKLGAGTSIGAFSAYKPHKVSKLTSAVKEQTKLKPYNQPSFNNF